MGKKKKTAPQNPQVQKNQQKGGSQKKGRKK